MKKLINLLYSRKLILILSLTVNIAGIVLFAVFINLYAYFIGTIVLTALFLCFASENLSTQSYKFVLSLVSLFLPLYAFCIYHFTKARRSTRRFRLKWRKINHDNAELLESSVKNLEELNKVDGDAVKLNKYILSTTNMPVYNKSECEYFSTSERCLSSIIEDLKQAKTSILLEISDLKDGETWKNIFAVLKEKALNGVEIIVLYDEKSCLKSFADKNAFKKLSNHNIKAFKFNKIKLLSTSFIYCRDKKNMVIIDGAIAYLTSTGFREEFVNYELANAKNSDGLKITGDGVWSLVVLYFTYVQMFTKENIKIEKYRNNDITKNKNNKTFIQPFATAPFYKDKIVKNNLLNAIYSAKSSITIVTSYWAVDLEVNNALKICSKNGVEIKLITSDKTEKRWQRVMTLANIPNLVKERVKVYQYEGNILSKQFVLIDNSVALIGGGIADLRNMNNNFEAGCFIANNSEFVDTVYRESELLITNSHLVTIKDLSQRNILSKLFGRILRFVWPIL